MCVSFVGLHKTTYQTYSRRGLSHLCLGYFTARYRCKNGSRLDWHRINSVIDDVDRFKEGVNPNALRSIHRHLVVLHQEDSTLLEGFLHSLMPIL